MAKTTKRKTRKTRQTKKSKAPVKERIRKKVEDKRFRTYWGMFFILFSLLLFISFSSFLLGWKDDQSLLHLGWTDYIFNSEVNTKNLVGKVGLFFSHIFMYNWFGIASYFFAVLSFIVGLRFLNVYKKNLLPVTKNIFFGIFWLSITLSLIFGNESDVAGGKFGYQMHMWFKSFLGMIGEITVLLVTLIAFFMLTIESFSLRVKEFLEKLIDKETIKNLFSKTKDTELSDLKKENKRAKNLEKRKVQKNKEEKKTEKVIVVDLDDDEKIIEVTEKKRYKLGDDGKEIKEEQEDDFEIENKTKITEEPKDITLIEKNKDTQKQIETRRIEVGQLTLDVTQNKDILAEKISENTFTNYDPTLDLSSYVLPPIDLLEEHHKGDIEVGKEELLRNKNKIVETLKHYKIEIQKIKATIGPTLTLYEIVPAPGVRISKIKNLEDDIALSLAAHGIRIIAPMPGRGTIGIEVPNEKPEIVSFKSVVKSTAFQESKMELPIALGKTISNESYVFDLTKMPHMLVAGATGQGKSVGLNAMIASLLYKKHPAQVKFVLVDPKKVELTLYERIENHFLAALPDAKEAIITDNQQVLETVNSLNVEMDERYQLLKKAKARNIKEYNKKFISRKLNPDNGHKYLPYIVLVVDEFADLIMTAGKEIELPIARLAQLARAIGIHLIVATQRPSTNIITGVIKANFPARVAFRVASMVDSRTILDSPGANRLIGRGDMLITQGSDTVRLQCAFIDTPELDKITNYIQDQQAYPMPFLLPEPKTDGEDEPGAVDLEKRDELFDEAAKIIVMNQQGSTSLIQRKLSIGYNRAGRIVDQLEAAGIVGPSKGSKARDVYVNDEYTLENILNSLP
jgi:S-DNA-T family DNA segregation ATPase FtsK/SpoIIIE